MAAEEGNKYALGNSGRAKQYETPDQLQADVDDYFQWCDDNPIEIHHTTIDKDTSAPYKVKTQRPYTIEGLALHLKMSRRGLLNYQKEEGYQEFFHIIEGAKDKITLQRVELASVGVFKEGFTKFLLINNTDYVDKTEASVKNTNTNYNSEALTPEKIKEINKALEDEY